MQCLVLRAGHLLWLTALINPDIAPFLSSNDRLVRRVRPLQLEICQRTAGDQSADSMLVAHACPLDGRDTASCLARRRAPMYSFLWHKRRRRPPPKSPVPELHPGLPNRAQVQPPVPNYDAEDRDYMIRTIAFEAAAEPEEGKAGCLIGASARRAGRDRPGRHRSASLATARAANHRKTRSKGRRRCAF